MSNANIAKVVEQSSSRDIIGAAIEAVPLAMVLTDPSQDDNPITYVNSAFEDITLYSRKFAIGRNCRFLQGRNTSEKDIERIRRAVAEGDDVTVDLQNYKADGTEFRNRLMISPIRDENLNVIAFVGIQRELGERDDQERTMFRDAQDRPIEDTMLMEIQHRVKNHLAMLVSLIRMQAAKEISRRSFDALSHRVRGLALLYDELSGSGIATRSSDTVAAGAYISRICASLTAIEGRGSIRVNVDCDEIELPVDQTARLGLLATELVTNALQHAFTERDFGTVDVRLRRLASGGARLIVEDDGCGLPAGSSWPSSSDDNSVPDDRRAASSGLGGSIVSSLAQSIDARIGVQSGKSGTTIITEIPPIE